MSGLAAGAAAERSRDLGEQLAGLDLADEVLGDHRDELDLGAAGAREHDHARAELVAQLIAGVAQDLGIVDLDRRREHLDALDRDGLGQQVAAAAARRDALLELLDLAVERLLLGEQLVDARSRPRTATP